MFERYTERARRVIFFARYEASQVGSPAIETEHMLLGVLREDRELARALPAPDEVRRRVLEHVPARPKSATSVDIPLTAQSARALALSAGEADRLQDKHIDSRHLLLALLREEESLAFRILRECGVEIEKLRRGDVPLFSAAADAQADLAEAAADSRADSWMRAFPYSSRVLFLARHEAALCGGQCIETTHLILALAHEQQLARLFPAPVETLREWIKQASPPRRETVSERALRFSEACNAVFSAAAEEAAKAGLPTTAAHILLGLLRAPCAGTEILQAHGFQAAEVRAKLSQPPPASDPQQGRDYV